VQVGVHQSTGDEGIIFHKLAGSFFTLRFEDHNRWTYSILAASSQQNNPLPGGFLYLSKMSFSNAVILIGPGIRISDQFRADWIKMVNELQDLFLRHGINRFSS